MPSPDRNAANASEAPVLSAMAVTGGAEGIISTQSSLDELFQKDPKAAGYGLKQGVLSRLKHWRSPFPASLPRLLPL